MLLCRVYSVCNTFTLSRCRVLLWSFIFTPCILILQFPVLGVFSGSVKLCRVQLDLTHNRVGPDGALSLAFSLTRNTTLRRLILRHNLIRDAGCEALARALSSAGASLTELSVAANGLSDVAATALGAMLATNTTICGLDVSANALGEVQGLGGRRGVVVSVVRRRNEVTLRRAWLAPVLGWVTIFGPVLPSRYVTSQLDQLSLASLRGR